MCFSTKVWRLWDFNSGKTGCAVQCSSVVFQEEENVHTIIQKIEAIEFPDDADKLLNDIHEMNETDQANELPRQEASKSKTLPFPLNNTSARVNLWWGVDIPVKTAKSAGRRIGSLKDQRISV